MTSSLSLIRGWHNAKPFLKPSVVTIGNFDGVHLGHQALLRACVDTAKARALTSAVVTFDPKPFEYFSTQEPFARLTNLRETVARMRQHRVDNLMVLPFDARMASFTPEGFTEDVLVHLCRAKHIVIGDDFRFGKAREGDAVLLASLGKKHGFSVEVVPTVLHEHKRISSSWIRKALQEGAFGEVRALLGRPYSHQGRIVHGEKLGRKLGCPTINIRLKRITPPLHGVYVVDVVGLEGRVLPGVANVGNRPAVDGKTFLLEVHLFDQTGDYYGHHVDVRFYKKLRDELPFDSLEALKEQMQKDCHEARGYFK